MLLVKISCGSPQASTAAIEQDARVKVATEKIEKGGKANYRHLCIETHLYTKTPDLQTTNKQGKVLRICGVTNTDVVLGPVPEWCSCVDLLFLA